MAKIRLGVMVGQASGSIGSTTFSRNRYGTYTRLRSKPVVPTTIYTQQAKAILSQATKVWQGLTFQQQQAWRQWALTHPITDRLGDKQILDGHTACTQLNSNLAWMGVAPISVPPTEASPAGLTSVTLTTDIGAGTFSYAFTATPVGAGNSLWVFAAVVPSAGIQFVKNLYRLVYVSPANQASPWGTFETELTDRFGTLQAGQVVHTLSFIVDRSSGLKSGGFPASSGIVST